MPTWLLYYSKKDDQQIDPVRGCSKMTDDALTQHPDTGEPVRRIISGGISLPVSSKGVTAATVVAPAANSCSLEDYLEDCLVSSTEVLKPFLHKVFVTVR